MERGRTLDGRGITGVYLPVWLLLLTDLMSRVNTSTHGADIMRSFCNSEFFTAQCDRADTVIMVEEAYLGRMRLEDGCVESDFGYLGCKNNVLQRVDNLCSGRRACSFKVLDETFPGTNPCHRDLKSYLKAQYTCVEVISPRTRPCEQEIIRKQTGVFSSLVSVESRCGSEDTPWVVEVLDGQKINITLYDFGASSSNHSVTSSTGNDGAGCRVIATVRETSSRQTTPLCGASNRVSTAFISRSNKIEIRIINARGRDNQPSHFLLHYEAIGCPNKTPPHGATINRNDSTASVTCFDSADSWTLHCHGGQWTGPNKNCTRSQKIENTSTKSGLAGFSSLPLGISVIIIVALALVIGLLVLAVGVICLRRVRNNHRNSHQGKMHARSTVANTGTLRNECLSHDPGQKHTVVCTLRNTQTATLIHPHRSTLASGTTHRNYTGGKDNDYSSMQLLSGVSSTDPSLDGEADIEGYRNRETIPLGTWCCECPYGVAGENVSATTSLINKPLRGNVPMYTLATSGGSPASKDHHTLPPAGMMSSEAPDITSQVHDGKPGKNDDDLAPEVGQIIDIGDSKSYSSCSLKAKHCSMPSYEEERTCQQCGVVERVPSKVSYSTDPLSITNNTFTGKRIP